MSAFDEWLAAQEGGVSAFDELLAALEGPNPGGDPSYSKRLGAQESGAGRRRCPEMKKASST